MKKNKIIDSKFIPFALPMIGEDEIEEVLDTLRNGWLTTGPKTRRFEKEFSSFVGAKHAMAVNSATSGLHLALEAIGIQKGDRVVTTPHTFTATAEVIRYLGADPLFVDIDYETFNIKLDLLDKVLASDKKIRAIIPVHFGGQACDMSIIMEIAKKYNIRVVEDAAHALPASSKGQKVGSIGDLSVFSFYATKTITTGEGGMVTTNDDGFAERIKTMRLHGISRDVFDRYSSRKPSWYYEVIAPGFKYNMSDISAAIGIHQLANANRFQKKRERIAQIYTEAFSDLPLLTPKVLKVEDKHAWHLYVVQLDLENIAIGRDRFIELMYRAGIGTSVHFIPLHIQPYWRERYGLRPDDFPISYSVYSRSVSLPIYPSMTEKDIYRVIKAVRSILTQYAK